MPLPKPKVGDTRNKFMSRCLKDDNINSEFGKNTAQKFAVCASIWEHHGKSDEEIDADREYKNIPFEILEVKTETKDDQEIGTFQGAFATQDKDLGGDIIGADAFDNTIDEYRKEKRNIKLFYNHQINDFPIGIVPINSVEKQGRKWLAKGELNLATQKGMDAYSLMKQGALTDLSIGYSVRDFDLRKDGTRFIKDLKLHEISAVNYAMNKKAKIKEVKEADIECEIDEELEIKAVPPYQDYPILKTADGKPDTKHKWDGTAAEKRVRAFTGAEDEPNTKYRNTHFYYDPENKDNFGGYKLLYVDVVDDKLQVIPKAIFEKSALLHGGRRGVDIPDADKQKITTQVNKYYTKMDMSSPLREKGLEYAEGFDGEIKELWKFDINDVKSLTNREDFNLLLSKSGAFSNEACEFIAGLLASTQRKSVENYYLVLQKLNDLIQLTKRSKSYVRGNNHKA